MVNRNYENIPEDLKKLKQWVCYKVEKEIKAGEEHFTKRLINPYTGKWAKVSEPRDWAYYSIAIKQMAKYKCDGISLCLTSLKGEDLRNDIFCIDLDKVLSENETTEFGNFEAYKTYEMFKGKTYIEYSISGRGLHILGIGNLAENSRCKKEPIETYDKNRFMSLTGAVTPDSIQSLGKLETELREANKAFIGVPVIYNANSVKRGLITEDDRTLIDKIKNSKQGQKFCNLFEVGSNCGDDSSDDFALCRILAFWTGNDELRIDSIFRQSALMRPKWDRNHGSMTYGQLTIRNAISVGSTVRNTKFFK